MKKRCFAGLLLAAISCNNPAQHNNENTVADSAASKGTYGYDASFLKKHTAKVLELISPDGYSKILLSADYQGRVMTSTATGDTGISFGWLNYDLIAAAEKKKQFNPVGGEERFWLGPEGGQYALYFKQDNPFDIKYWQVPPLIDTASFELVLSDNTAAVFVNKGTIRNYSGTDFTITIVRKIRMLDKPDIEDMLADSIPQGIKYVGYQTENSLQNAGTEKWTKEKGLLSIWLLGMFSPTPKTMVIIPFKSIANAKSFITDNYFGNIPPGRLQVKDSVLYFVCDGKYRSKIGLSPVIAKPIAASFDFQNNSLTVIFPEVTKDAPYVNSKWEQQMEPYKGDVINAYNDGPLGDGTQMGPFYEIESSSPALELEKGVSAMYKQTTIHFQGSYESMRQVAKQLLSIDLDDIKK